jgi:hypothetical protein
MAIVSIDIPLLKWQRKVFASKKPERICVCGRGSGKTRLLGVEAFIGAMQGKRVIIAGPTFRQAMDVFRETKSIADAYKVPMKGEKHGVNLGKGYVMMFSDVKPNNARGANANLVILDEAAYCSEYFYTDVLFNTGRLANFPPSFLIASTPKGTDNWLSQRFSNPTKNAEIFHATYLDNPCTSSIWKDMTLEEYAIRGEMTMRRELMGEILDYTENSPFSQFLKNIRYSETWEQDSEPVCVGVDLGGGSDFSSVTVRKGNRLLAMAKAKTPEDKDLQELVERTINAAGYMKADKLYFDATSLVKFTKGLFTKFADRVIPVNFGAKATDKRCVNLSAQCYIGLLDKMREGITYGAQCSALKNELIRDLLSARPTPDEANQGKFGLIKKDQIKKEIGRSPDLADSAALAFINYIPIDLAKAQARAAEWQD